MDSPHDQQTLEDAIGGRVEKLKELYAELFILLDESLNANPERTGKFEEAHELDRAIQQLMTHITGRAQEYRAFLQSAGDWQSICSDALIGQIGEFNSKLQSGLEATLERVTTRTTEVSEARIAVKGELNALQEKKKGRLAYKGPSNPPSTLLDSNV